jgi:ABC-type bacteriocin/lantibiotic exporter with double-glycine peptidase domain
VETTLDNLEGRRQRFACIAHVQDNHFALIKQVTENAVVLIDPPHEKTIGRSVLGEIWQGKALLIAATPLVPEEELHSSWLWYLGVAGGVLLLAMIPILWRMWKPSH